LPDLRPSGGMSGGQPAALRQLPRLAAAAACQGSAQLTTHSSAKLNHDFGAPGSRVEQIPACRTWSAVLVCAFSGPAVGLAASR